MTKNWGCGFDFGCIYSEMVNKFEDGALFVEIGTWKGQSAFFMANKIKESNKKITFYTIDLFEVPEDNYLNAYLEDGEDLYEKCLKNLKPLKDYVNIIKGDSRVVHSQFKNDSIDFLFLDGDHSYEGVKKDLELWFPKVKKGGVIGGHDYTQTCCGVKKGVDEFFKIKVNQNENSWTFNKI